MMSSEGMQVIRRNILKAALPGVPFDGWSWKTLRLAATAAGYDETMARRAFPGGPAELVDFFQADADRRMETALAQQDLSAMRIRDRIATAVRTRLDVLAPHREATRRAIQLQMRPSQSLRALKGLYRTVDAMWWAAGDTATDFNHYTKRALLAGVYASTLVIWLNDQSDDFEDSWAFLDRRIGEVMQIQKATGRLRGCRERLPSPLGLLATLRYGAKRAG
jgi:ubiquinone biosynthesis protein COQ9